MCVCILSRVTPRCSKVRLLVGVAAKHPWYTPKFWNSQIFQEIQKKTLPAPCKKGDSPGKKSAVGAWLRQVYNATGCSRLRQVRIGIWRKKFAQLCPVATLKPTRFIKGHRRYQKIWEILILMKWLRSAFWKNTNPKISMPSWVYVCFANVHDATRRKGIASTGSKIQTVPSCTVSPWWSCTRLSCEKGQLENMQKK